MAAWWKVLLLMVLVQMAWATNVMELSETDAAADAEGNVDQVLEQCRSKSLPVPGAVASVAAQFAPVCENIYKGLVIAGKPLGVSALTLNVKNGVAITGKVDLSALTKSDSKWDFSMSYNSKSKVVAFDATSESGITLSVAGLQGLGANGFSNFVGTLLSKIGLGSLQLNLKKASLLTNPVAMVLHGSASLNGYSTGIEVYVQTKPTAFAAVFMVSPAGINAVKDKIFGGAIGFMNVFEFKNLKLTVSTIETYMAYPLAFSDGTSQVKLGFGGAVSVQLKPPASQTNSVMKFISSRVTGALDLAFQVSLDQMEVSVLLPPITLSSRFTLVSSGFHFIFKFGSNPPKFTLGYETTLRYVSASQNLDFYASIDLDLGAVSAVSVTLAMKGAWKGAFGIARLSISDLKVTVGITPQPPFVAKLALQGSAQCGSVSGTISISLDLTDVSNDYFILAANNLRIMDIKNMLNLKFKLPAPIDESGFSSVMMSYLLKDQYLPSLGYVPKGIHVSGAGKMLHTEGVFEVVVSSTQFKFFAALSPIHIGLASLYRSSTQQWLGPSINVDVGAPFNFDIQLMGYFSCAHLGMEVAFHVTPSSVSFSGSAKLFAIRVQVSATVTPSSVQFTASVKDDHFFSNVMKKVVNAVPIPPAIKSKANAFIDQYVKGLKVSISGDLSKVSKVFSVTFTVGSRSFTETIDFSNPAKLLQSIVKDFEKAAAGAFADLLKEAGKFVANEVKQGVKNVVEGAKKIDQAGKQLVSNVVSIFHH